MFGLIAACLAAVFGWFRAGKLGGNRMDRLQYAAVFGIIGFLIGIGLTLAADWMGLL